MSGRAADGWRFRREAGSDTTMRHEIVVTILIGVLAASAACDDQRAEWASSNTIVATVSATWAVTGQQAGRFDLSATAMGVAGRKAGIRVGRLELLTTAVLASTRRTRALAQ